MKITSFQAAIDDMHCTDCENIIEEALLSLPGIQQVKANFSRESVNVEFDKSIISNTTICAAIRKAGYDCRPFQQKKSQGIFKRLIFILFALGSIALLLQLETLVKIDFSSEDLVENFSYGLLFLIGVLTSFHCIGMCGVFVIGYSTHENNSKTPAYFKHLSYGVGKVLSYSFFGAIFGLFGQFITVTLGMRTLAAGLAGGFLILYGLSMLESFAPLRRLHLRLPKFFIRSLSAKKRKISSPFIIGLMNGLMIACGPLQAMYIFAAGTGSALEGAKILAIFALGTLPVMLAFGFLTTAITGNTTRKLLKISSVIIIALGALMLNRSLLMSGSGYDFQTLSQQAFKPIKGYLLFSPSIKSSYTSLQQQDYQLVYMEVNDDYRPNEFVIKKAIPVKWIINVTKLSFCNKQLLLPSLGIKVDLKEGLQVVEFSPQQTGILNWSCSMGMMSGRFQVQE